MSVTMLFFPVENLKSWLSANFKPILITAVGLFFTYLGFYLLYSRFGASYYTLFAVASIITTSIILAVVFFHEPFNIYHGVSVLFAFLTILFFFLGQK
jgi:drug/metabolite transporter (DMT)-like permease